MSESGEAWDVAVVGGGPAGAVVARLLASTPHPSSADAAADLPLKGGGKYEDLTPRPPLRTGEGENPPAALFTSPLVGEVVTTAGRGGWGVPSSSNHVPRLRVLLLDQATFPRRKVCGCCLNRHTLSALTAAGLGDLPAKLGAVPLHSTLLAAGGRTAAVRLPGGVSVSREAFDAALVDAARDAGVTLRTGVRVQFNGATCTLRLRPMDGVVHKPPHPDGVVSRHRPTSPPQAGERWRPPAHESGRLDTRPHPTSPLRSGGEVGAGSGATAAGEGVFRNTISAKVVIDATGLNGRLTDSDIEVRPGSRIGAGTVLVTEHSFYRPGTIYMATGRGGYVGLVRLEDGRLDVAAAFDAGFVRDAGSLPTAAERTLHEAGLPPLPELPAADWKGTPPLTRRPVRVAGPGWFAVGDAAGYVEPFTGEGMAWAIAGAVALAPIAARAVHQWDDSLAAEWAAVHRSIVGRRQAVCRLMARVLRSPLACRLLVRGLRVLPGLANPFVRALNRPTRM